MPTAPKTPAAATAPAPGAITPEQLDHWFTYHLTSAADGAKIKAITECREIAAETLRGCLADPSKEVIDDAQAINAALRAFADAVVGNCPPCADTAAAIRSLRLARNAANALLFGDRGAGSRRQAFLTHLDAAQWQANAAIACGGR